VVPQALRAAPRRVQREWAALLAQESVASGDLPVFRRPARRVPVAAARRVLVAAAPRERLAVVLAAVARLEQLERPALRVHRWW
jgi:hypothetical protein